MTLQMCIRDREYPERLKQFVEVLRKAHPEIKIVGSSGPQSEGKDFDYLWPEMKNLKVDLVDEHFYRPESWFLAPVSYTHLDVYKRQGSLNPTSYAISDIFILCVSRLRIISSRARFSR